MTQGFVETLHFLELKFLNYIHSSIHGFFTSAGAWGAECMCHGAQMEVAKGQLAGIGSFPTTKWGWGPNLGVSKSFTC